MKGEHILNFKGAKNTHISLNYFVKWFYQDPYSGCHVLKMKKHGHDCGLPKGLNCQVVHQPRQHEMEISAVASQNRWQGRRVCGHRIHRISLLITQTSMTEVLADTSWDLSRY